MWPTGVLDLTGFMSAISQASRRAFVISEAKSWGPISGLDHESEGYIGSCNLNLRK